jgi:hypothetical protein
MPLPNMLSYSNFSQNVDLTKMWQMDKFKILLKANLERGLKGGFVDVLQ